MESVREEEMRREISVMVQYLKKDQLELVYALCRRLFFKTK